MKPNLISPSHLTKTNAHIAHRHEIYGEGIGVAVLDTGIYPHKDFSPTDKRIAAFLDFVHGRKKPYDDSGHGTHICGILGSGAVCQTNNSFAGPIPSGQTYLGIAPKCHLIVAKILDCSGNGKTHTALAAFQWIYRQKDFYNIRIINISMGMAVHEPADEFSPFMDAINELWDMGFIVIAAAGNNGPGDKTITAPGISRKVITVGSCEDPFSGRGPTINCIKKPDLCAPGKNVLSCANQRDSYIYKSGTSMSAPMVSGAAALLLSVHPHLTNKEVKKKLLASARNLGLPWQQQGAGMLDIARLLSLE